MAIDRICAGFFVAQTEAFSELSHTGEDVRKRICDRIVEHRESDLAPFPAQVIDVKTAIRFLRLNGRNYHIDTDKIALWGDSSGAHSALIAGITGDNKVSSGGIS